MRASISQVSRALRFEQSRLFLEFLPDGVDRRYFAALVYTGCAPEVTGLRVGYVDFERGIAHVN